MCGVTCIVCGEYVGWYATLDTWCKKCEENMLDRDAVKHAIMKLVIFLDADLAEQLDPDIAKNPKFAKEEMERAITLVCTEYEVFLREKALATSTRTGVSG